MSEHESNNALARSAPPVEKLDLRLLNLLAQGKLHLPEMDYQAFQLRIDQCIREHDLYLQTKQAEDFEYARRLQVLCDIAAIPISHHLEHLDACLPEITSGEILIHCAAGITICWHMGQDLALARKFVSGYLVLLGEVFTKEPDCSASAAELIAQAYLFRALLATQLEGPHAGMNYYLKALKFSEVATVSAQSPAVDIPLKPSHRYGKQPEQVLQKITEAIWLLKPSPPPSDFTLISDYLQEAISQEHEPAMKELRSHDKDWQSPDLRLPASQAFSSPLEYASTGLHLWESVTKYQLDAYVRALDDFTNKLEPVCDAPELYRLGFLPNRALAALRLHDMDQAITSLRVAIPQVLRFGNEQELVKAREAYHLMQFLLAENLHSRTTEPKNLFKKHD